jgi:hypothetical protein
LNGDVPPDSASAPVNTRTGWTQRTLWLPLAPGVNLQSYAGQMLYLHVYNNSNAGCTIGVNCRASEFYFDDVNLAVCGVGANPEIAVPGGHGPYHGGETLFIYLKGHSPGLQYDLKISGPVGQVYLGRTGFTNAAGDTPGPLAWLIPFNWPDGSYDLTSHPAVNPPDLSNGTQVAVFENIELNSLAVYLPLILK